MESFDDIKILFKETREQFEKIREQSEANLERFDKMKEQSEALYKQSKLDHEEFKEIRKQFKDISEMQKMNEVIHKRNEEILLQYKIENQKKFKKTEEFFKLRVIEDKKELKKLGEYIGNVANNQGDVAEEFFFNTLQHEMKIGSYVFNSIIPNLTSSKGKLTDEFDIVMVNGNTLAIIETKYKTHVNDIEKLKEKKIPNFQKLFPVYNNFTIYVGIAGFHINKDVIEKAEEYGFFILKRHGKLVEADTTFMKDQRVS